MLKVLAIVPSGQVFGLQIATLNFFKHLNRKRISTRFLVTHWSDGSFANRLRVLGLPYDLSYLGFLSKQLDWANMAMTVECLIRLPQLFLDVVRLRRRHAFDVIYISGYHLQIQMLPMLMWWKKPVVCHVHDYYPSTPFYQFLFRLIDRYVTAYVAVSDAIRLRLESLGIAADKIERIYNGIETSCFNTSKIPQNIFRARYGWPQSMKLVAFVGQIAEHKGLLDFVEAARIIHQRYDVKMLIVGRTGGEYFEQLKKRVGDLGLEETVLFCGFEENTVTLFSSIDILVVPSREEDPAPLVAVEAMAAAKPVIVTRSGGLAELVGDGEQGFVVEKRDVDAIADRIVRLLDDETLAREMGESGRAKVEQMFSIQKQTLLLEDCLVRVSGRFDTNPRWTADSANA